MVALARYLDLPARTSQGIIDWVLALHNEIGIPHTLADIGIDEDLIAEAAAMAERDPAGGGNPVPLTANDYAGLYGRAIAGTP